MNKRSYSAGVILILNMLFFTYAFGQGVAYDPLHPPNTFQHPDNPLYWKNKLPYPGYWQQDVYYNIKADIDEKTDIIDGEQQLTYWNNSPDTLTYVYFHLYQNAFQPGSYYDKLHRANDVKPFYGNYEGQGLGTEVEYIRSNAQDLETELDNTVMKVYLPMPLVPRRSITFDIKFRTYFDIGSMRRRMKPFNAFGYKHYNGVHWYPRIAVYDRKFGWTTDQHLGREFYGDFGTFDVELTFANNMIVDATGNLLNEEEVMPDSLRQKLDIRNFADKEWNSPPGVIIEYDTTQHKTWKFHAENVHDFAWTADPTYRIGDTTWNGILCRALVQEPHAQHWQNAAEFTAKVIRLYSLDFGMYEYPKMIVADARDGMEYPMLTLDNGRDPYYRGLLAHEIGHNWFFGMLGNNETYRAFMDEGFTQFLTAWALENIDGRYPAGGPSKNWYRRTFGEQTPVIDTRVYYGYLRDAVRNQDPPLNTHSDAFNGALRHGGGYGHVYYKTAAMLYNLQYVLGDSLFQDAMRHYVNQWKICHPYPEDFRNSIIHYTDVDLNWFFDQWLETTKSIDYAVKNVKKGDEEGTYEVKFERKGRMQMPIDFTVTTKDGDTLDYHIPNTWFVKETDATVLPKWYGWDKLNPTYTAEIEVAGKIENVIIDPSERLADVYMPDNRKKGNVEVDLEDGLWSYPNWRKYELDMRPDLWFNSFDGFKAGFHMKGDYMAYKHKLHLSIWGNTRLLQGGYEDVTFSGDPDYVSWNIIYETPIEKFIPHASVKVNTRFLDGLDLNTLSMIFEPNPKNEIEVQFKSMYRYKPEDLNYVLNRSEWNHDRFNNSLNVLYTHKYNYNRGNGRIHTGLRSSAALTDYSYHYLNFEVVNDNRLGRFGIKTRVFARGGTGNQLAPESALFLAGANPEELMENKYTRSRGIFPAEWAGFDATTNHFHYGGGLNLRGYAGYYVVEYDEEKDITYKAYKGNSGAAVNLEVDFADLVRWRPKKVSDYLHLDVYLFGDAGILAFKDEGNDNRFTDVRMDAGVGTALTIKKFGPFNQVKPLTVRFDMPLLLSHTPAADPDYFQFRWIIGVNRAF